MTEDRERWITEPSDHNYVAFGTATSRSTLNFTFTHRGVWWRARLYRFGELVVRLGWRLQWIAAEKIK